MRLIPYVVMNGAYTLNDNHLREFFLDLEKDGLENTIFYEGDIYNPTQFIEVMKHPETLAVFIEDEGKLTGVAWLNDMGKVYGYAHFAYLKEYWPSSLEYGKAILNYWMSWETNGRGLLDVIIGIIPTFNQRAQGYVERLGFEKVGIIPKLHRNYMGESIDVNVNYYVRADDG